MTDKTERNTTVRSPQLLATPAAGWEEEGGRWPSGDQVPTISPGTRVRPLWRQTIRPGSLLAAEVRNVIDGDGQQRNDKQSHTRVGL